MENFSWTCPHCNRPVTITDQDVCVESTYLNASKTSCSDGYRTLETQFIVCPNPKCKKYTLVVTLYDADRYEGIIMKGDVLHAWQLIPPSQAKQFPDYIPKAILDDYNEACLIKDLSPKASATLSRRCLQGIVRDYWKVKPGQLANEIDEIKDKVETLTWEAIDAVRSVGNIGAHMEKDVNLIIDIEPREACLLINLVETLLKDWYITRYEKEAHLAELIALSKDKEAKRRGKEKPASGDD